MTLTVQFYTMMTMIAMGIWLGAAVDTYGRFMHPGRWNWLLFCNDILFWILQSLFIFYVLLQVNEGEIRFYVFLALLCGFAAYRAFLQKGYQLLLEKIITFTISSFHFLKKLVLGLLVYPTIRLLQLLLAFVMIVLNLTMKILLILMKICFLPFKWIGYLLKKMIPNKWKKHLVLLEGIFESFKNKFSKWFNKKKDD
ncbi:spore cortex biosynthesis protein YabQ [Bacillus taeanensis]|uniref:Spore cortex biosynthesis protein YabQ n=1 Tax=Bacillus taeanensis TaxID=273032 RepID=A0A366XSB3_9BACI|nr:spore cortex biosynthesis protein YabQ [Bacillus taeanensis]RBW67649.1 spore cortex biosynthesis protein YabQ [Bacillus taeanensis]